MLKNIHFRRCCYIFFPVTLVRAIECVKHLCGDAILKTKIIKMATRTIPKDSKPSQYQIISFIVNTIIAIFFSGPLIQF